VRERANGGNAAVVVAVSLALALTGVSGSAWAAGPPGHAGPDATAAKKKKKKKRKKCNRRDQSPLFNALSCTRLSRSTPSGSTSPTGSEIYDFCRNNTYRYRELGIAGDPSQGYVTTYRGRWKVLSSTSGSSGVSGAIEYTITGYQSVNGDGTPAEPQPASVLSAPVAFGPFGVDFADGAFLRGKAPC
jgi:hypothetical protein